MADWDVVGEAPIAKPARTAAPVSATPASDPWAVVGEAEAYDYEAIERATAAQTAGASIPDLTAIDPDTGRLAATDVGVGVSPTEAVLKGAPVVPHVGTVERRDTMGRLLQSDGTPYPEARAITGQQAYDSEVRSLGQAAGDLGGGFRSGARRAFAGLMEAPVELINAIGNFNPSTVDIGQQPQKAQPDFVAEEAPRLRAEADQIDAERSTKQRLGADVLNDADGALETLAVLARNPGIVANTGAEVAGGVVGSGAVPGAAGGTVLLQAMSAAAQNANQIREELAAKGVPQAEIDRRVNEAMLQSMAVNTVVPLGIPGGQSLERVLSGGAQRVGAGAIGRRAIPVAGEAASEVLTEVPDQIIQNLATDKDPTQDIGKVGVIAGLMGAGQGVPGALLNNGPEAPAPQPEPNLNPNLLTQAIGQVLDENNGARVQLPAQATSPAQESRNVQAESEERPGQESRQEREAGTVPSADNGQANGQSWQVVAEAPTEPSSADPLAPRVPVAPALPEGVTRESLVEDYQAAATDAQRAAAAGRIAAFDAANTIRDGAGAAMPGGVAPTELPVEAGRPSDAAVAPAPVDPDAPYRRPVASRSSEDTEKLDSALTRSLQLNERRAAEAEGRPAVDVPAVTGTYEVLPDSGNNAGSAPLAGAIKDAFGLRTIFFRPADSRWDGYNALTRVKGAEDAVFINENSGSPFIAASAHELTHGIKTQHPELYARLDARLREAGANPQKFMEEFLAPIMESNGEVPYQADSAIASEELYAETGQALWSDKSFLRALEKRDPKLLRDLVRAAIDWIDTVLAKLAPAQKNIAHGRYYDDLKAVRDAFLEYYVDAAKATAAGKKGAPGKADGAAAQRAYHGSPNRDIKKLSTEFMGKGEGNQAFGWGNYTAGSDKVANNYRVALSPVGKTNGGALADRLLQKNGGDRARTIEDIKRLKAMSGNVVGAVLAGERMTGMTFGSWGSLERQLNGAEEFIRADKSRGQLYAQEIPEDNELLYWDGLVNEQPEIVQQLVRDMSSGKLFPQDFADELYDRMNVDGFDEVRGRDIYQMVETAAFHDALMGQSDRVVAAIEEGRFDKAASLWLDDRGIPGLRYKDGSSRGKDGGSFNYVIWNDDRMGDAEPLIASRTTSGFLRNLTAQEKAKLSDKVAAKVVAQLETLPSAKEMAAVAAAGQAKRGWYKQSADTIAAVFGPEAPQFAGLLAALSPQISVEGNLKNALNVWKAWVEAGRPTEAYAIRGVVTRALRDTYGAPLDAWMNNSVRALQGTEMLSGPKVDSFMKNLLGNVEEVTNDAWMANYALVDQKIFAGQVRLNAAGEKVGQKGPGYLAMNARVRETAKALTKLTGETWTPAEVQETIWSWAKTLTELADSAGEIRNARELVQDKAITDELIASTPDFGTLFAQPEYASILEESGYGEQVEQIRTVGSAARAAGNQSKAGGKARPFAEDAQQKLEVNAARRIDKLRQNRLDAERANRLEEEEEIPFSRRATNNYGDDQGTDLAGMPTRVKVDGKNVEFHGYKPAQDIAAKYAAKHGNTPPTTYAKVDVKRAERIAAAYDKMKHDPENPEVKRAYAAMIEETLQQYRDIMKTGLKVEFIGDVDPYAASPRLAIMDVVDNNHMWVFPTEGGFGSSELDISGNPLLAETEFKISGKPAVANDIFRVVHDYFGHIANGVGFRADGEENAWREHASMYSPLARRAMTTETRGQNSWVNYGPNGEANQTASSADTVYADQKTGLLPDWVSEEGRTDASLQTDTPAFKKWFGDSKVVDADGEPLVVYHGASTIFDTFDTARSGENTGALNTSAGFFFTNDEAQANSYVGVRGHRVDAYLNIKNPRKLRGGEFDGDASAAINDAIADYTDKRSTEIDEADVASYVESLKRRGFDGIEVEIDDGSSSPLLNWVVFNPTQIKSATSNSGAFDPDSDSIIASRGFSAKPRQPDAVSVDAYHYSTEADLETLNPAMAGSGVAGRERKRFGTGTFGRQGGTAARVNFYVREPGAPIPQPETIVRGNGAHNVYRVQLDNLYDLDADPRDLVGRNQDETEEAISEAGFDGFTVSAQGDIESPVAVVFDIGKKRIPVEPVEREVVASRQTSTPAFKKWFGDSKVVDANGRPLVVYHGTKADFDAFDIGRETKNFGTFGEFVTSRAGAFFTPDKNFAQTFAGRNGKLLPTYLSIQNPLDLSEGYPNDFYIKNSDLLSENNLLSMPTDGMWELFDQGFPGSEEFIAAVKADGYDGVRMMERDDEGSARDVFVAFRPSQIKSATGNSGAFDPVDPSIIASRRTPAQAAQQRQTMFGQLQAQGYAIGSPTQAPVGGRFETLKEMADRTRINLQDKMLPVLRAQDRTGAVGQPGITSVTLDDMMNAYRNENLMHGRAKDQLDRANTELIFPAQAQMKRLGVTPQILEDVMLATHAPERNAKVAAMKGGMKDGAAGITTADARAILAGTLEGPYSGKKLTPEQIRDAKLVWAKFRQIRNLTIDNMVDAGQITQALATSLRNTYTDYVPLRGKASEFDNEMSRGTGRGLTVAKAAIKRALGRGKGNLPENIIGEIVGDLQRSIAVKEKARVARSFLKFALANPMPDLFTVEPVDLEWKYSEAAGEAYLGVRSSAEDVDRSIIVRRDGEPVRIRFEDPQIRDAMMNMGVDDMSTLVAVVGSVNRWRSAVLTRYNPAFTPINVLRDIHFGFAALAAERGGLAAARALFVDYIPAGYALWKDARNPSRGNANVPNAQKTYADWAREAAENGMKTGLTQVDNVVDLQRRMSIAATTLMQLAAQGRPISLTKESVLRPLSALGEGIERVNDATENALRLASYIADRKRGASPQKAAEYAKNLTINFNRKGKYGPALNAVFLFYNASIQGTHAVQRVMRDPKVIAYLVALGGLQAMFASQMMDDDELDGVHVWDEIPDYVKRTSLVIPLGMLTGNKRDYFALPMPFGFNVFTYAGGRGSQQYHLGSRPTDSSITSDIVKSLFESFSPLPVTEGFGSLFGDQVGFMLDLAANKDDLGRKIANTKEFGDYEEPLAMTGRADTPYVYQWAAQTLAELGGGDLDNRVAPNAYMDVAPEQLKAITEYIGGGLASLANKSVRWYEQLDAKNLDRGMDVLAATPIASRMVGTANEQRAIAERYYTEKGEFARKRDVLQDRMKDGADPDETLRQAGEDDPMMAGLTADRYKGGKKKGDVKRTATDGVTIKNRPGFPAAALKDADKAVKAQGKAIKRLRDDEITNGQVFDLVTGFEKGGDTAFGKARVFTLEDLGLPATYNRDAVAPARVRNRAIKLIQDARQESQRDFLQPLEFGRQKKKAANSTSELKSGENTVKVTTDRNGNLTKATGVLRQDFGGGDRGVGEVVSQKLTGSRGDEDDQGGHAVGHRFMRDQGGKNLFPQNSSFNVGAFKRIEDQYARYISQGKEVRFTHTLGGVGADGRPTTLTVEYGVYKDGKLLDTYSRIFRNQKDQQ